MNHTWSPPLPRSDAPLLVRTWFNDTAAWEDTRTACLIPTEEGFVADLEVLDHPGLREAPWQLLRQQGAHHGHPVLFIADHRTQLEPGHPVLVVSLHPDDQPPTFRCPAAELWSVENNLTLGNMDWEEFTGHTVDGVLRGFSG
ncbi:MAG: hypothetical protein Q4D96_03135 [Propionibacteriaceae bacterium]|nr:hypothetical protein [Propionibacteriaceae bacterium]